MRGILSKGRTEHGEEQARRKNARRKTNGAFSLLSRNRLPNLAWKLPYCVSGQEGERMARLALSPRRAATSYFIPRLHNRLFVSRFYPRSESHPLPLPLRAPRGYLSADGIERVGGSEGMVKKCPEDIVNLLGPPPPRNPFPLYIYSATEPRSICFWAPLRGSRAAPEDGPA